MTVTERSSYCPAWVTPPCLCFVSARRRRSADEFIDLSVVIYRGNSPIAVWPLSVSRSGSGWRFYSGSGSVRSPLFLSELSTRSRKKLCAALYRVVQQLAERLSIDEIHMNQVVVENGLDTWSRLLIDRSTSRFTAPEFFIELSHLDGAITLQTRREIEGGALTLIREVSSEVRRFIIDESDDNWIAEDDKLLFHLIEAESGFLVEKRDGQGDVCFVGVYGYSLSEAELLYYAFCSESVDEKFLSLSERFVADHFGALGVGWYRLHHALPTKAVATNVFLRHHSVVNIADLPT